MSGTLINQILQGDALAVLKTLPDELVDCVITSPPYWNLRNYGVDGQLGLEPTFGEYLEKMLTLFDEIKRVLKSTGTVWVNLGDTFNGSKRGNTNNAMKEGIGDMDLAKQEDKRIAPKSLLAIPDRFKITMIDRGWICRNDLIWYKRNCMPSSAKDRFTVDYERVFFFTKSERYYFETQYEPYSSYTISTNDHRVPSSDIREGYDSKYKKPYLPGDKMPKFGGNKAAGYGNPTYSGKPWVPRYDSKYNDMKGVNTKNNAAIREQARIDAAIMFPDDIAKQKEYIKSIHDHDSGNTFGRIKRCVWDIVTRGYSDAHFATFPEQLVETPIRAGCPEFVCVKCGVPRQPIIEHQTPPIELTTNTRAKDGVAAPFSKGGVARGSGQKVQDWLNEHPPQFKGLSDCGCGAGFQPGIVLDPFFGSGTVGVVALKNGRNFLGVELNPEYIKMAEKRLAPLLAQQRLAV